MGIRARLFNVYWTIRGIIAPNLRYSQYVYEDILKKYVNPSVDWIEMGCGHSVLPSWRQVEEQQLIKNCRAIFGIDFDWDSLKAHSTILRKLRGDITKLPFKNESFDLVTANMVVEHLDDPARQFMRNQQDTSPQGNISVPYAQCKRLWSASIPACPGISQGKADHLVEGRQEHDVFETHYAANTEERIRDLAQSNGFEIVELHLLVTDAIFAVFPPLL